MSTTLSIKEQACNSETWEHIALVAKNITIIQAKLIERMLNHDRTKLASPEVELFAKFTNKLQSLTYNSPEYKSCLEELRVALDHHYANNRHHPEHYKNGVNDMTLVDLIEMFCDWYASTKRHADGNIRKSIEANRIRFGMSDQLAKIFDNTISEFGE